MPSRLSRLRDALPRLLKTDERLDDIRFNQGLILSELNAAKPGARLADHEFRVFSQWGEDGIIQHLTRHLDIAERTFIEFGVEDFTESNCRFLLMKDRWRGFVVDGSRANIERLRRQPWFWKHPLQAKSAFITRENIAALLDESGFDKRLGLLSVDLDGVDYHVLDALAGWRPAILVVEYNDAFGYARAVTVPYDPAFVRADKHYCNQYWGASLPAFVHLLGPRGYALVGVNSVGSNAFFVRRELLNERVREASVRDCAAPATFRDSRGPNGELTFLTGIERARVMADMPLVDVASGASITVGDLLG